jgi:hypothetical protein
VAPGAGRRASAPVADGGMGGRAAASRYRGRGWIDGGAVYRVPVHGRRGGGQRRSDGVECRTWVWWLLRDGGPGQEVGGAFTGPCRLRVAEVTQEEGRRAKGRPVGARGGGRAGRGGEGRAAGVTEVATARAAARAARGGSGGRC